ncbi:lysine--tRNA ligase [Candidatus Wolfebacteria bacterium]|nr:lysine--tRNA ligase [Candidatus Wolfebacteria bacterium]
MIEDLIAERKKKLNNFVKAGIEPYPEKTNRTHKISDAFAGFPVFSIRRLAGRKKIFVCGRIFGMRVMGNIVFYDLRDESGKIQGVLKKDNLPKEFALFKENLDIGDFIEIGGFLFKTKTGEKSVEIKSLRLLTKSLRPLPSQWHGLEDIETRLRKRYLDILINPEVKDIFIKKNIFWKTLREYLQKKEFLEMETPVLENTPGGADAEPFMTHHNALNHDFYLRISLEIALKKMLVAGYEKIFEIGRIFRNEGISAEHLQDYAQMEFYWAYSDMGELMEFVEKMYKETIKKTCGKLETVWQGKNINWSKKWPKIEYAEIFKEKTGLDADKADREELFKKAADIGLKPERNLGRGRLIDLIFKKKIRPMMIQPCLLVNPVADIEPLAKRKFENSNLVCRFQVVACGTELGKGFSEANDPLDQRKRFEEQMALREKGDKEAQRLDEEFLEALEYGMPPAAGFGLSERLFAVLMDKSIRETTVFPLMRAYNK